jgi:hypothetical protein
MIMKTRVARRLYPLAALLLIWASPAQAQFQPRPMLDDDPDVPTGERYHIEAQAGFWSPSAEMQISSEGLGIIGSLIDFKDDLGLDDERFTELHVTLRPARRHKFRFQYIPIKYTQSTILTRNIIFNGQLYPVSAEVESQIDWKAYRFGYEFDFLVLPRGFGGFVLDFKYTDVRAELEIPGLLEDFYHARAPIPAVGGIFRVYVVPNVSITGEITGFKLPENLIEDTTGRYIDIDFYGTVNITDNFGAQLGYRSLDLGYDVEADFGDFRLRGFYFGGVARY